jgi:cytochrome c biogenesis protein CcmG, thiol:disulfide interchange protein DsbE
MSFTRRSVALIASIISILLVGLSTPVRAQDDDQAMRIYELARDLHYENIDSQGFTSWVNGNMGEDTSGAPSKLVAGKPMPDFKFKLFYQTGDLTRAGMKGPYMLNFWASWCPPCRDEFPRVADSIERGELTIPIFFINEFDTSADAQHFLWSISTKVTIAADDAKFTFARKSGIKAIPQTILVDAQGNIQAIHTGDLSDLALQFFTEISKHPGVGAFDASNPEEPPADMPTGVNDVSTTHSR